MQELEKALKQVKGLHQEVLGRPAPDLVPPAFVPFPVGVDPREHALLEVQRLQELAERVSLAPRPGAWMPFADSFVSKEELIIRLEIPGISREDIEVHVVGGECVVRGERKPPQCAGEMRPMRVERAWGPFERRFVIPVGARVDEMKARALDGLLELRVPLKPIDAPKEQKIDVT